MHRLLTVVALFFHLSIHAQIDPKKLDSLSRFIDSSAKVYKSSQDSFTKVQDSIYREALKTIEKDSGKADTLLSEQKQKNAKKRQQIILRIMIGVVLLIIGIIAVLRRRKKTKI